MVFVGMIKICIQIIYLDDRSEGDKYNSMFSTLQIVVKQVKNTRVTSTKSARSSGSGFPGRQVINPDITVFGITGLQSNTCNLSVVDNNTWICIANFVMYVPESVSQKGASVVDVQGNVVGHLLQGRNLLSGKVFGNDCLGLGSDIQVANGTNCDRYKGVDAPEVKISQFLKAFLFATHLSLKVMS